jgi:hypothetical protein
MGAAEIARISDHKLIFELPFLTQRIVACSNRRNLFVVAPIWNDMDATMEFGNGPIACRNLHARAADQRATLTIEAPAYIR